MAGACGQFVAAPSSRTTGSTTTVRVGSDELLHLAGDTTTTVVVTTTSPSSRARAAATGNAAVEPTTTTAVTARNRTVADVDGFRLYLGIGSDGRVEFTSDETTQLSLGVENVTKETRQYDTNEKLNFEIARAGTADVVWDNVRCKKGQAAQDTLVTGTNPLAPGETVSYLDSYPRDTSKIDTTPRADCRVPAGAYDVYGFFAWCPPGSAPSGTCYPDHVSHARSLPVRIKLT